MKRFKPYLYTSIITILIIAFIFFIKGIYPFGTNSVIWGDMHSQVTSFYYHLYDTVYGSKSLLVDFSTSGGINFIGIIAYYILSPFSLLVLLVPRNDIYLMVSVIVGLKMLVCSLTCLYFLRTYFKNMPSMLHILLALIYAFSSYSLSMLIITPWIDAMYMFPLVVVGLKKVLDLEKPTFYLVTLTLSLIFCFYITFMVIIFIFLYSFIYLLVYKEKEERKKAIVSLGIYTVLSILLSSFVVIPAYLQINESYRMGFYLRGIINSKTGTITDRVNMLLFGGLLYSGVIILIQNFKKHKKFLTFYLPILFMILIPVVIEPIHKMLLFGSYACFPYRFGFILPFLLILGAAYIFNNYEYKGEIYNYNKIISLVITVLSSIVIIILTYKYYYRIQFVIYMLTFAYDHIALLILCLTTIISIIATMFILKLNKKLTNYTIILLFIITLTHIGANAFCYIGMDKYQKIMTTEYVEMNALSKTHSKNDYYHIKNEISPEYMMANNGIVTNYPSFDHFTSLTNRNNLESLKKMGYSSMWVKTFSLSGNMFLDSVLGNKYLMTKTKKVKDDYQLIDKVEDIYLYSLGDKISYGYLLNKNDTIFDKNNSFEISNSLYQNINNTNDNLFTTDDNFELTNIKYSKNKEYTSYNIIDHKLYSYLEKDIKITGKKTIYLEMLASLENLEEKHVYNSFNVYINNKLYKENAFTEDRNGVLDLGTYTDTDVNIKIELLNSVRVMDLTLGIMDNTKYEEFINNNYLDTDISFNRNKVSIKVNGSSNKILFLPITYNTDYKAVNNGKSVEVLKLYDNFIGIKLNDGENNITLSYIPKGLKVGIIISFITLIISFILVKNYKKIMELKLIKNIMYYSYVTLYLLIILTIYVGLTICFMLSYFMYL